MKKNILIMVLCLICFGCGKDNSNLKQELSKYVQSEKFADIIDKLEKNVDDIMMFPDKQNEDEFIYFVEAIKENIAKFSKEELKNIYDKLQIQYDFKFNDIKYSEKDFENILEKLRKVIDGESEEE